MHRLYTHVYVLVDKHGVIKDVQMADTISLRMLLTAILTATVAVAQESKNEKLL